MGRAGFPAWRDPGWPTSPACASAGPGGARPCRQLRGWGEQAAERRGSSSTLSVGKLVGAPVLPGEAGGSSFLRPLHRELLPDGEAVRMD